MVNTYHFYLVDTVSETILGQFFAKSSAMAKRMIDAFDFEKAKLSKDDCKIYCDMILHRQFETFSELPNTENVEDVTYLFKWTPVEVPSEDN